MISFSDWLQSKYTIDSSISASQLLYIQLQVKKDNIINYTQKVLFLI